MAETNETRYRVGGMDCAACATKIDTAVRRVAGVADVSVSVVSGTMTVRHDGSSDLKAIEKRVTGLGYSVSLFAGSAAQAQDHGPHDHHDHGDHAGHDHDHDHVGHDHGKKKIEGLHGHAHAPMTGSWWQSRKGRLTIVSGAALIAAYAIGHLVPAVASYAFVIAMLVGLMPIARRAVMAALSGTPFSIEMLMTIAALGAVIINAGEEAATVVFLFLVGELLEGVGGRQGARKHPVADGSGAEKCAARRQWPDAGGAVGKPRRRRDHHGASR